MKGLIASTSAALRRNRKDVSLLLRRAALCVALGEPALARQDYERVLALDPVNPEALKYVDLASYGAAFDPYAILGVPRSAGTEVISLAFRRLAKQWHPDRWMRGSEAEQAEAETRFKQLNLAQAVLTDAAKRRKYDAGTASVADLMVGWWDKVTSRWGGGGAERAKKPTEARSEAKPVALPPEGGASSLKRWAAGLAAAADERKAAKEERVAAMQGEKRAAAERAVVEKAAERAAAERAAAEKVAAKREAADNAAAERVAVEQRAVSERAAVERAAAEQAAERAAAERAAAERVAAERAAAERAAAERAAAEKAVVERAAKELAEVQRAATEAVDRMRKETKAAIQRSVSMPGTRRKQLLRDLQVQWHPDKAYDNDATAELAAEIIVMINEAMTIARANAKARGERF